MTTALHSLLRFLMAVSMLVAPTIPWAQSVEECLDAHIPAPVLLPDGSTHPAGLLTICRSRNFSPVTAIHRIYMDGRRIGNLLSRAGVSEAPTIAQPFILFYRMSSGSMRLVGYVWPDGRTARNYLFRAGFSERNPTMADLQHAGEP